MKNIFGKFLLMVFAPLIALVAMSGCESETTKPGLADGLLGNWEVTGERFRIGGEDNMYKNDHVVEIQKVGPNRIRMIGFTNVTAQQGPNAPIKNPGDVVEADVEEGEKGELIIYIAKNYVLNPTWDHTGKSRTELWPIVVEATENNKDMPFPAQTVTINAEGRLQIHWITGGLTVPGESQELLPINASIVFVDALTGAYNGLVATLYNSVWTKI